MKTENYEVKPISYDSLKTLSKSPYVVTLPTGYVCFTEKITLTITNETNDKTTIENVTSIQQDEDAIIIHTETDEKISITIKGKPLFTIENPPLILRSKTLEHKIYSELSYSLFIANTLQEYREALQEFHRKMRTAQYTMEEIL